jgi:hypothetical protein
VHKGGFIYKKACFELSLKISFLFPEEGGSVILQNVGTASGFCGTQTQEVFYIEHKTFLLGSFQFLLLSN